MIKLKKTVNASLRWIQSCDNIQTASCIVLWIIILNLFDVVTTMIAMSYKMYENNPLFRNLFDANQYELAMIIKLTTMLACMGFWLYSFIISYNAIGKLIIPLHKFIFYSGIAILLLYLWVVTDNIALLIGVWTNKWFYFISGGILFYGIGTYFGTKITRFYLEN
jgi:hypothetical protein